MSTQGQAAALHRGELWAETTIGYPVAQSGGRSWGRVAGPGASQRHTWPSGRLYLSSAAPVADADAVALLRELSQRLLREMFARPLATMARAGRVDSG